MLTLKELSAKVVNLLARVDEGLKAEVAALKTAVDETMVKLQGDLTTALASVEKLGEQVAQLTTNNATLSATATGVTTQLDAACSALKLELKADATVAEKITALQTAVSASLSKLAVDPSSIPAGKATGGNLAADAKTLTMTQFNAISPAERMAFLKGGGKLSE